MKSYFKTSDISKYTVPLKVVDERPKSKIKYRKRQTLGNLMIVSKLNKDIQGLLIKNEPSSQSICNNHTNNDTCQDKGHDYVIYINTELIKYPVFIL